MSVIFSSKRLIVLLFACLLMIAILNLSVITLYYTGSLQHGNGLNLYNLFYVDHESNLPSFFNTVLLLIATVLLYITFSLHKQLRNTKSKNHWLLLSFIFLFLSADESISIHEHLTNTLPEFGIGGSGYFKFAWVIPYALVTLFVSVYFIRFLLSLQKPVRVGFILSGTIYLCGVIGFEMIGANIAEKQGVNNITFALVASCEEMFEMIGVILFINYIVKYIRLEFERVSITISS